MSIVLGGHPAEPYSDISIVLYRIVKIIVSVLLGGFAVKYFFCDIIAVRTNQMSPAVQNRDIVLVTKTGNVPVVKKIIPYNRHSVVVFAFPQSHREKGCLRIAAVRGDTIAVTRGLCTIVNRPRYSFSTGNNELEALPAEYSPRDNMMAYRIPRPGDTLVIDSLTIRDVIFTFSIIRQENGISHYFLKPLLYIDDSLVNEYPVKEFYRYTGTFGAIPDSLRQNWFFWERLEEYLKNSMPGKRVHITFSLMKGQSIEPSYIVKNSYYFLLADDWYSGYDSRYFGPVGAIAVTGRVLGILFSLDPQKKGFMRVRWGRIGRVVK
jgi:signal peptidase I